MRGSEVITRFPLVIAQSTEILAMFTVEWEHQPQSLGGSGCCDQQYLQQAGEGWFQLVPGSGVWDLVSYLTHGPLSS